MMDNKRRKFLKMAGATVLAGISAPAIVKLSSNTAVAAGDAGCWREALWRLDEALHREEMVGLELAFSQYLQLVEQRSALGAALVFLPASVAGFIAGPLAGRLMATASTTPSSR